MILTMIVMTKVFSQLTHFNQVTALIFNFPSVIHDKTSTKQEN